VPAKDPRTGKAPVFPYVSWRGPDLFENEDRDDGVLEVDIWDDKADTTELERLADLIDGDGAKRDPSGLHRWRFYHAGNVQAILYRASRLDVPDPDPGLRRRRLTYRIHVYFTRG